MHELELSTAYSGAEAWTAAERANREKSLEQAFRDPPGLVLCRSRIRYVVDYDSTPNS